MRDALFQIFKIIHILSVASWFGAAVLMVILGRRAHHSGDHGRVAAFAGLAATTGSFFGPVAGVVLLSGVATVLAHGGYGFEEIWIIAGIVGVVAGSIVGARYLGPINGQIAEVAGATTVDEPRLAELRGRLASFEMVDLVVLVIITALMVWRPTLG